MLCGNVKNKEKEELLNYLKENEIYEKIEEK